jgi:hypothetical protein
MGVFSQQVEEVLKNNALSPFKKLSKKKKHNIHNTQKR